MATLLATSAASPKTTMATDVATPKAAEEDGGSNKTFKGKRFFFALGLWGFATVMQAAAKEAWAALPKSFTDRFKKP